MQQEITISINDALRFIGRGLLLALIVAGAAGFVVYQLSQRREPVYESTATVISSQPNTQGGGFSGTLFAAPLLDASAYTAAADSDSVLGRALVLMTPESTEAATGSVKSLRGKTSATSREDRNSSLIYIKAEANDAQVAAQRATAVATALVEWDEGRAKKDIDQLITNLEAQIQSLSEQIRGLQASNAPQDQIDGQIALRANRVALLNNAKVLSEAAIASVQVLQEGSVPSNPVSPKPLFDATLAALLGIFLTYGLLLVRNALDTKLRSVEDVAAVSGLPVIAEFPKLPKGIRNLPREASSYLRTNLLFSTVDANPKVLLVTSANSEEGKSSIAISLAESFVRNGYRTLLIDADLRKPVIAGEYRINNLHQASLEECLKNPYTAHKAATVSIGAKDYLYVIPTFQPAPQASELLSRGFRECLDKWRQEYDVIVIDSAPVLAVADALAIAPLATGTLLAINQQRTDRRQVRSTVELLHRVGVRILGIAVTHVSKEASQGSRYSYGYGYAESEAAERERTKDDFTNPPQVGSTKR
ncbi:tyrosine-protein kinase domain-containing protein [soil metagenome]